jgi:hypothetical protein
MHASARKRVHHFDFQSSDERLAWPRGGMMESIYITGNGLFWFAILTLAAVVLNLVQLVASKHFFLDCFAS